MWESFGAEILGDKKSNFYWDILHMS